MAYLHASLCIHLKGIGVLLTLNLLYFRTLKSNKFLIKRINIIILFTILHKKIWWLEIMKYNIDIYIQCHFSEINLVKLNTGRFIITAVNWCIVFVVQLEEVELRSDWQLKSQQGKGHSTLWSGCGHYIHSTNAKEVNTKIFNKKTVYTKVLWWDSTWSCQCIVALAVCFN